MKRIGLTGGIGSGKSIVARIVIAMGYPVYFSDDRAKEIITSDPQIREGLLNLFGSEIYIGNTLNRKLMSDRIFQNEDLRLKVNELIHPRVRSDFDEWSSKQTTPIVFNEAAILFETGAFKRMDYNILVTAPVDLRIERVMGRDGLTKDEIIARIENQWADELKSPLADYIINNDDKEPILRQVESLIEEILAKN